MHIHPRGFKNLIEFQVCSLNFKVEVEAHFKTQNTQNCYCYSSCLSFLTTLLVRKINNIMVRHRRSRISSADQISSSSSSSSSRRSLRSSAKIYPSCSTSTLNNIYYCTIELEAVSSCKKWQKSTTTVKDDHQAR